MTKNKVVDSRFDFRKGRNTSISPDLLDPDELVDMTNARLNDKYGAFSKRSGTQRIHSAAFPAAVLGVTQWDSAAGRKQTVVISNGDLYFRDGTSFALGFTKATSAAVARTTVNQGAFAGWIDPDGTDNGINTVSVAASGGGSSASVGAANRIYCKLGDPAIDNFVDAVDDYYTLSLKVTADANGLTPGVGSIASSVVSFEYSTNDGGVWASAPSSVSCDAGASPDAGPKVVTKEYTTILTITGAPAKLWIRMILTVTGYGAGTATARCQCFSTTYPTNYPVTWTTGTARFSLTEPAIFAPFRASTAGAPLVLYIASGGHYFKWTGDGILSQLDPGSGSPTATSIISYHTRMIAMTASVNIPGLYPKTIFWSKIGDAENFNIGSKALGGSAVTDFLTGQQLTALEVIGSSLLMATNDSIMRFQGHASDEIVISQDTEGVSAEVGVVGPLALKRFENVAAFLAARGPYVCTETSAVPIGEQVLPDFNALDSTNVSKSVVAYNRGRKELLFAVPGVSDGGLNKTVFVQATRLQAWYGPWTYSFGIGCMAIYTGASGIENIIAGCNDGYVRLMDVGSLDDVLSDGTGGTNITMTVEIPVIQFGLPGLIKALDGMYLQATLPTGSALKLKHGFDGAALVTESITSTGTTLLTYRIDLDDQGSRLRLIFEDASATIPIVNGFVLNAWDYNRAA